MTTLTMSPSNTKSSVIAVYSTHDRAEAAVRDLQHQGFDMTKLSIVGKDHHDEQHVLGYYNVGDRMKAWGKLGAFWGGMWGLVMTAAVFFIPGVGPVAVAGPVVACIVAALENAVVIGGAGVLAAALVNMGIPKDTALKYEKAIHAGECVLIANGAPDEVARAKALLDLTQHVGVTAHAA
jgi:uncharacterized membrane protein